MPANLPPQYFEAEKRYRAARTPQEKIACLEEMFAIMPKHKGTDHLQGEIKSRIAKLKKEIEQGRSSSVGRREQLFAVEREGAAQVVLVGPPNVGKSQILASLTRAEPEIAPYPFTTHKPHPGMMPYEDIQIQLVDLPPITPEYAEYWVLNLIRNCDLVLLVYDSSADNGLADLAGVVKRLQASRIRVRERRESDSEDYGFAYKRSLVAGNKADLVEDSATIEETAILLDIQAPTRVISAQAKTGLEELKHAVFEALDLVRVYTKEPGKPADFRDPLVLQEGSTVVDAARSLHKDFAERLKYARIWGKGAFDGQRVEWDHKLQDKDVLEFHTR